MTLTYLTTIESTTQVDAVTLLARHLQSQALNPDADTVNH